MPISVVVPTVMPAMIVVVAVINPIPPTTRLGRGIGRQDCRAECEGGEGRQNKLHRSLLCLARPAIIRRGGCHYNNLWEGKFTNTVLNGF